MSLSNPSLPSRAAIQTWSRDELCDYQLKRLNDLLSQVVPNNAYYQRHWGVSSLQLKHLDDWGKLPTSSKSDWQSESVDGVALHHTYPQSFYRRYHRTSGTRGRPMVILDTEADWRWWTETWQYVLDASQIGASDRILMAFSFGPFIGFWSAHDACLQRGCLVIPSGGLSTLARIELIRSSEPTVLFGTPSYALHLAHEASRRGISLQDSSVQTVFVAGEPGGSIPSVRKQIEELYGARVMDHTGATEIGPWGFGSRDGKGVHIIESEFIAEFENITPKELTTPSETKELILTSLGRTGAPVLRYRTNDIVAPEWSYEENGTNFVRLEGGILGRADDMFVIRGVNVFPSSIESIVRRYPSIGEFRIHLHKRGELDEVELEVESETHMGITLEEALQIQLGLRIPVRVVPSGSLPTSEGKSRRLVRR